MIFVFMWSIWIMNILAFYFGFKLGILERIEQIPNIENTEIKIPNPLRRVREKEAEKEAKKEQERLEVIMENIDSYDGTSNGQKEIPR